MEDAGRLTPVVGRSLVRDIRAYQPEEPSIAQGIEGEAEDEQEPRPRLDGKWKGIYQGVRQILADEGGLTGRTGKVIDDL